jgi:hypothetical protein
VCHDAINFKSADSYYLEKTGLQLLQRNSKSQWERVNLMQDV